MDAAREFNLDGLVGPTHNYAGLSWGNVASTRHQNVESNPRRAALEGLAKMRRVAGLGVGQAVLPPLVRPHLPLLRSLGFSGSPRELVEQAGRSDPVLLAAAYSASSMWTANAATVSPAPDCLDRRTHFTPANLVTLLHRSIEAADTTRLLRTVFHDGRRFAVHDPLPGTLALSDEGAANHTRLCAGDGRAGIGIFVYGRAALDRSAPAPGIYPARQTAEACHAIARQHGLDLANGALFWQQLPAAIDAGVFHNDVIAVGRKNVLLVHEQAFLDQSRQLDSLRRMWDRTCGGPLHVLELAAADLPLADAVGSYLFNSQLLSRPDGRMTLLCPQEVAEHPTALQATRRILDAGSPVDDVQFADLRQSMQNGGGPACLRLRVVLDANDVAAAHPGIFWTPELDRQLVAWVERNYRDRLAPDDLRDPQLVDESFRAHEELLAILGLPEYCDWLAH